MSLINDALKRAKEVQPEPARAAAGAEPLEPVHYSRRGLPWYFIPVLFVVIAGGGWFLLKGWDAQRQATPGYGPIVVVKAREPVTPITPGNAPANPATPGEKSFTPAVNNALSVPFTAINRNFSLEDTAPATAAAPQPTASTEAASDSSASPTFKLQGIFYRSANPSAMVNGKSVFVGDRVSGATVKGIDRQSVALEYEGQTKILTLE